MVNIERINSPLSLSHEKLITSVDPEVMDVPPETFRAYHGLATSFTKGQKSITK